MKKPVKHKLKLKYVMRSSIVANPKPSRKLLREWKELDEFAQKEFQKPYDALTDRQKTELHYNINTGKYDKEES